MNCLAVETLMHESEFLAKPGQEHLGNHILIPKSYRESQVLEYSLPVDATPYIARDILLDFGLVIIYEHIGMGGTGKFLTLHVYYQMSYLYHIGIRF